MCYRCYQFQRQRAIAAQARTLPAIDSAMIDRDTLRRVLFILLAAWGVCTGVLITIHALVDLPWWILTLGLTACLAIPIVNGWFTMLLWLATLPQRLLVRCGSLRVDIKMFTLSNLSHLAEEWYMCATLTLVISDSRQRLWAIK